MDKKFLIVIIAIIILGGGVFAWYQFRTAETPMVEPIDKKNKTQVIPYVAPFIIDLPFNMSYVAPFVDLPYTAPFDPKAIMIDPRTGMEIVSNQVIVRFRDGVPRVTRRAVIVEFGCIIVGRIPSLNIYQLKIPDGAHPVDLATQFEKNPYVLWADVNAIVHPETPEW